MSTLATLASYLPPPLAARILRDPQRPYLGGSRTYPAAVLFADLAKFTPLTETFCRAGPSGVEGLTQLLNTYFTALIEETDRWGGVVGKFAGDAMTVFFTGEGAPLRAAACAQAVLQKSQAFDRVPTPAGEAALQMKLGLAFGDVLEVIVGDDWRAEFIFAGTPLDAAAQAEHHASPSQIVLDASIQAALPSGSVTLSPIGEGFAILDDVAVPAAPIPLPPLEIGDAQGAEDALRPFLPRQAYERVRLGLSAFVNEHRQVTTLFVSFEGIDYTAPQAARQLGDYLQPFFIIVARFEGAIRQIEMGDKGSKVIVVFGAPAAHENDPERALLCALALQALANNREEISAQKIGVTTGLVFAGNLGAPHRQEYAAIGDVVNLSARLMQAAAAGQILADSATRHAAPPTFTWQALPPMTLKGKSQPVEVFALARQMHRKAHLLPETRYALPMVGRQSEMAQITARLERVIASGQGSAAGISAEAGMGKTRLAAEVIQKALALGFQGFAGNGMSHGVTTPYLAWRPVVRGLLDLDEESPLAGQTDAVRALLASIDPFLAERLPLIGDVLGVELPDTVTTAAFDADLRRQSLFGLIGDVIRFRASQNPLLLVIEDAHWLDELSRELARSAAAVIANRPVFFLTVYRPPEDSGRAAGSEGLWASPPPYFDEFRLPPFSLAETRELIGLKLGDLRLQQPLLEKIEQLSQGNPFFLDELVNLVQSRAASGQAVDDLSMPDSIQTLIVSRLDQLAESEKMTLRVASVIGSLFRNRWLLAIYPGEIQEQLLLRDLEHISSAGMIVVDRPAPELEYLFRHAVMQEVIYGTLSFANRRMLHERVADYLERAYGDDIGPWYGILAYHFARAGQAAKECLYVRLAARQSARQSAFRQAFDFYGMAIALMTAHALGSPEELFDLRVAYFDVGEVLGELDLLREDAAALGALSPQVDAPRQVQALIMQGIAGMHVGLMDEGRNLMEQAIAQAEAAGDRDGLARALFELAGYYFDRAEYDLVKRTLRRMTEMAGDNAPVLQSKAQRILGWVYYDEANYDLAEQSWLAALEDSRRRSNKPGEATTLSNLGALFGTRDEVEKGIGYLERGLALSIQLGYKVGEMSAWRMLADFLMTIGAYERAWECTERCIELSHQLSENLYGLAYAWSRQAVILLETGADIAQAEAAARRALERVEPSPGQELKGWVWFAFAEVMAAKDDKAAARQAYEESLRVRREMGQIDMMIPTLAGLAEICLRQGDLDAARQRTDEMLVLAFPPDGGKRDNLRACFAAYLVLLAAGEMERARDYLHQAYEMVRQNQARLQNEAYRQSFVERVSLNRQIIAAYRDEFGFAPEAPRDL